MDSNIRKLIGLAQNKDDHQAKEYVRKAYLQMKSVSDKQVTSDGPEPFGKDLMVLCAETAYQIGELEVACNCLSIYFNRTPPVNQFLCRAYMCQAQLNAPTTADDTEKFNKAVTYLLKAVEVAKKDTRYHFLVFNASVIYWQLCRPLLKPNYRRHLSSSLPAIVKSLDDTDDPDFKWRAELKIALIEAYLDAEMQSEAARVAEAAISFIETHVPDMSKRLFGLMILHHLSDAVDKMMTKSPEMGIYYKICLLKRALELNSVDVNIADEMNQIMDDLSDDINTNPVPPDQAKPTRDSQVLNRVKVQTEEKLGTLARPYLLLELGRLAIAHCQPDTVVRCVEALKDVSTSNPGFYCEVELLKSQVAVVQLAGHSESYQKSAVDVRLEAISKCAEALLNAIRLGDPGIIQAGCVTQWNLCLPLLQPNLRKHVRRPLTIVAEALEKMNSLMVDLRCLLHTELAKCEEDEEQLAVAIEHLQKALRLDDGQVYREGLEVFLHRLQMCIQLYEQPERGEDVAAMIIEQAQNTNSGTVRMKRSLLVKAGQALAPDDFLLVLDSESDARDVTSIKDVDIKIKELSEKAKHYVACVQKADGHLQRLGNKNDKERAHLWGDLAKVARKQEVWDVCRVAARFCLLYDDGRWQPKLWLKNTHQPTRDQPSQEAIPVTSPGGVTVDDTTGGSAGHEAEEAMEVMPPYDRSLVRLLAEIRFISGEAIIHQLRSEGVELCDLPHPPIDTRKKPKGFLRTKAEDNPNWIAYIDWIKSLSQSALSHFLRGAAIGAELNEPWIVCNAATYIWNYANHLMMQHRHQELAPTLQTMLDLLKQAGYAGNTCLVVGICNALALGLLQPWLPSNQPQKLDPVRLSTSPSEKSPRKVRSNPSTKQKSSSGLTMSPDATVSLKAALAVCEYAIAVTNGDSPADVVPIAVRLPLLQTWVQVKHWLQSPVGKGLGLPEESNSEGQDAMTRAMVAIEILRNEKHSDFKDVGLPSIPEAVELLEAAEWTDGLVELQMWTSLGHCALQEKDHANTEHCFQKSLDLAPSFETKKRDSHEYIVAQELLGYISAIYGQSLIQTSRARNNAVRKALGLFVQSASYGRNARNGDIVMTAARHFWNGSLPLIGETTERELLRDPLLILLKCISETTDKNKYKMPEEGEQEEKAVDKETIPSSGKTPQGVAVAQVDTQPGKKAVLSAADEEDLSMRAALYCILFQSFIDKGDWEGGLKAMETAIKDMPRTNHRIVIYKHLVVVKARLNLDISAAMERFKHESEDCVASIWHQVALSSKQQLQQLEAYQKAIESIVSSKHDWLKFEYLLEFAEWLYCNERPLDDAINQLEWAIDILLNMNTQLEGPDKSGKKKSDRATPQLPAKAEKSKLKADRSKDRSKPSVQIGSEQAQSESSSSDLKRADQSVDVDQRDDRGRRSPDGQEINVSRFIPVKVDAEIGVLFRIPLASFEDLIDLRQLEGLFRSYTLLARIAGRHSPNFTDHCLMAYAMVMQMWKVSVGSVGRAMKEIARLPPPEETTKKGLTKHKKGVEESGRASPKKKRKEQEEATTNRPKNRIPIDALPSNLDEWSTYEVPDEVFQAFNHPVMASSTGITNQTIQKPTLTLWYLDELMTMLRDEGFSHLALPVVAMADTVTRNVTSNRSLSNLIHLQAVELCQELNLVNGVQFHESLVEFQLNDEDQARAHEEIIVWRNKQSKLVSAGRKDVHVGLLMEEEIISHPQNRRKSPAIEQKRFILHSFWAIVLLGNIMDSFQKQVIGESNEHLFPELGTVCLREVWLKTAEIMIRNCIYRPALQLLNETRSVALAFGDKGVLGHTLFQMGRLSFAEAQYKQAYSLTQQAQEAHNGNEMFWYETTILMLDAILKDPDINPKEGISQARELLQRTISVFAELELRRPNKAGLIGSILSKLQTRLTSLDAGVAMAAFHDNGHPQAIEELLAIVEEMEFLSSRLMQLGCRRDAVAVMRDQSTIVWRLAQAESVPEMKHGYYIEAAKILQDASRLADAIFSDVQNTSPLQDASGASLPVQRESVEVKIAYVQILLDIFQIHVKELMCEETTFQRRDSVIRALNDLVRETPTYTPTGKNWLSMTRTVADDIMSQLTSAHGLSGNIMELRAKTLCLMGRCLRLLSQLTSTDPPVQWNLNVSTTHQETRSPSHNSFSEDVKGVSDGGSTERDSQVMHATVDDNLKEQHKYGPLMIRYYDNFNKGSQYLYQATECLLQAVNLSLEKGYKAIVSEAALELVECIGRFDPGLSSQYLALYQSCQASEYLHGLLRRALTDPSLSQQSALLHQLDSLQSNRMVSNATIGPTFKSVVKTLDESSMAWQRLSVLPQHLDLLKEFPTNFLFLVLQHSSDRSLLYGAILDKPKQFSSLARTGKPGPTTVQAASKSRIVRMETSASRLDHILSQWKSFKRRVMQFLLKQEFQCTVQAQQRKDFASATNESTEEEVLPDFGGDEEELRLQNEFHCLLRDMEDYLQPIMSEFDSYLRLLKSGGGHRQGAKSGSDDSTPECVIVLADQYLLELPLEALRSLRAGNVDSVSRDISLQMFYHRFHVDVTEGESDGVKKEKVTKKAASNKGSAKKPGKAVVTDRTLLPGYRAVDTNLFRYIVDPHKDSCGLEEKMPLAVFRGMLEEYSQFTSHWTGITGDNQVPSVGQYEEYLLNSGSFIFYGMERFLAYLPPHKAAFLDLSESQILILIEHSRTNASFGRQAKLDVAKSKTMLSLENPLETAMLLSLAGMRCCFANQWHCSLKENALKFQILMKDLLVKGKSTGQAFRRLVDPHHREKEDNEEVRRAKELEEAAAAAQKAAKEAKLAVVKDAKDSPKKKGAKKETSDGTKPKVTSPNGEFSEAEGEFPESPRLGSAYDESQTVKRDSCNMVCYGLPNYVIVQPSKR